MKRIVCILDSLSAGGAETFIMKLYRKLDKNCFQIDFIVCKNGIYDDEVHDAGGRIFHIPLRTKNFFRACNSIRKIVSKYKYDTVIKLGSSPIVVTDLISAKLGGAKVICVRSCNAPTTISFKMKVIEAFLRPIMNIITDIKIAPSDLAAEYTFGARQVKKEQVHFLHNAVDLNVYRFSKESRKNVRKDLGIKDECKLVGHIGRFVKQKNHMRLIDIFAEYHNKESNTKLLLAGEGELMSSVCEYVKELGLEENIIFVGVRKDIPDLLSAIDIFILPSLYEGMPNTVIEAQALGLPCIISDSITKEANITGNVAYCSLDDENKVWVKQIDYMLLKDIDRNSVASTMAQQKYDIDSSVQYFTQLLF